MDYTSCFNEVKLLPLVSKKPPRFSNPTQIVENIIKDCVYIIALALEGETKDFLKSGRGNLFLNFLAKTTRNHKK